MAALALLGILLALMPSAACVMAWVWVPLIWWAFCAAVGACSASRLSQIEDEPVRSSLPGLERCDDWEDLRP